jgi:hypothetical protein
MSCTVGVGQLASPRDLAPDLMALGVQLRALVNAVVASMTTLLPF